jgi:ATP-dependent DNA helicase RecG
MAVSVAHVTPAQGQRMLELEEGHFGDLKSVDIAPASLTKHLSAFANADGGEIYVGIDEPRGAPRVWRGFHNQEAANAHIQTVQGSFPLGQGVHYTFLSSDVGPGYVLQLTVQKTAVIILASDGTPYIRSGAQSLPVRGEAELRRLRLNKGLTSFETTTLPEDVELVTNSVPIIRFMLEVIPTNEPEPWLTKQRLIVDGKPTVAALLLFAEEPQACLPKRSAIKVYRYKTTAAQGTRQTLDFDPITIEGCLYDQISNAVAKTVEIIEGLTVLGPAGLETVSYPFETLHEIITNAVLHRDYSIADDIHVRIFDNRVEVESPGRLPAHITVDNILDERFARNGAIVRIINKFPDPPNKDVGEGLNTAFDAMRDMRLRVPTIDNGPSSVTVSIRHEPIASPEELVIQYLQSHHEINNSKGREICHIGSENVMKRVFERLMDRGMIERVPGKKGRASAYQLTGQSPGPQASIVGA